MDDTRRDDAAGFYREHFAQSSEAIIAVNVDGTIDYANDKAATIFGTPRTDLIGRAVEELMPHEVRSAHTRLRRQQFSLPTASQALPNRVVRAIRQGHEILVAVDIEPLATPGGPRLVATVRAIDEWLDLVARMRSAFEDAPVAMALATVDAGGDRRIQVANRALTDLLGYPTGGLDGESFRLPTAPEDEAGDALAARQIAQGERTSYSRRKRYRHRAGHYVWTELHSQMMPGPTSPPIVLAHIFDVDAQVELERERAQREERLEAEVSARTAALAESDARLRLLLDTATSCTWDWDLVQGIVTISPNLMAPPDQAPVAGSRHDGWEGLVHPDDWPTVQHHLRQHLDRQTDYYEGERRLRTSDGRWAWFWGRGRVVERGADGTPLRMIGVETDISDQRSLKQQLVHSAKMQALGSFAGGIAHDFNNVLAIVRGHVEFLRIGIDDPDNVAQRLATIERAVDRAAALVRQLLQLGQPRVDHPVLVDLVAFLAEISPTLAQFLGEDITLELQLPDEPATAQIDVGRLEALILNLAANARDAMPRGGTLQFILRLVRDPAALTAVARLDVIDSGVGIAPDTLGSIFEPFFTTKPPGVGTGLGLSNCYSTITEAGGSITARSTPHEGTTITVDLPVVASFEAAAPEYAGPSTGSRTATILVVEDQAELLELSADVLRTAGFRVHEALDAAEALEILGSGAIIDLVLTDAVMPDMSGPELGKLIGERWPAVDVLYLSGYAANTPTTASIEPTRLLAKPVGQADLIAAVEERLGATTVEMEERLGATTVEMDPPRGGLDR